MNRLAVLASALTFAATLGAGAALAGTAGKANHDSHQHFIGKPRAPLDVQFRPLAAPAVGVPLDVAVTIRAPAGASAVLVEFSAGEGLALVSGAGARRLTVGANGIAATAVQVRPDSGGALRLTAVVSAVGASDRGARPVSLALNVPGRSTVTARKPAPREQDASGQLVEPMQGITSVDGRPR